MNQEKETEKYWRTRVVNPFYRLGAIDMRSAKIWPRLVPPASEVVAVERGVT
jgi:hypothetical protein